MKASLLHAVVLIAALPNGVVGYQRSYTPCSGTQIIASIGECTTAVAEINAAGGSTVTAVSAAAATTWPQGCFYHVNGAYWQPSTTTGGSTPTPDDNGNIYICRSGYEAGQTSCSAGTAISSFAACMEASLVVANRWSSYERTATQCATGNTALVSDAECSSAAGGTWATQSYASAVGTEWPQGCFINSASIYSQDQIQQSTGQLNPSASDGGNVYLCRSATDPGTQWPQGCFVHNGNTWYSASAGSNNADFRGSHRKFFAFVSSPGYQFAPYFQEVDFWYNVVVGAKQLVHGTFMTKAAWHVRTANGRHLFIKADAMDRGVASYVDLGGKDGFVTLKPGEAVRIDDVNISTSMLTVHVDTPSWSTNVTSKPIYGLVQPLMNETHVHGHWALDQRRFDVQIQGVFPQNEAHGVIGHTYREWVGKRDGKMDVYAVELSPGSADADGMLPPLTTSAQGQGVIEGVYTDYQLRTIANTSSFKYSRYALPRPAASAQGSTITRTAFSTDWEGTTGGLAPPAIKKEL